MSKDEIVLIQTEMGVLKGNEISGLENILSGLGIREILDMDIVIYQSEIDSLVETEMNPGCHEDYLSDYEYQIDFYLSNANEPEYLEYICSRYSNKLNLNDNKELLIEIQELVIDGIKTACEEKTTKIKELADEVRDILENITLECNLQDDIYWSGGWYNLDYTGEFPIKDVTLYKRFNHEIERASKLVQKAINNSLISDESELELW